MSWLYIQLVGENNSLLTLCVTFGCSLLIPRSTPCFRLTQLSIPMSAYNNAFFCVVTPPEERTHSTWCDHRKKQYCAMKTALILLDLHPNFSADAETSCWSLPDAAPLNWLCPWSHNYMHHFCDYKQLFETAKCANVCKADKVKNILMYRWSELHWNWDGGLWSKNVFTVYFFHISLPVYPYVFLAHLSVVHWFIQPLSTRALIFSVFLFLLQRELPFFLTFFSLSFYLFHTRTLKTHRDTHTHARTHTRAHTHTLICSFSLNLWLWDQCLPQVGWVWVILLHRVGELKGRPVAYWVKFYVHLNSPRMFSVFEKHWMGVRLDHFSYPAKIWGEDLVLRSEMKIAQRFRREGLQCGDENDQPALMLAILASMLISYSECILNTEKLRNLSYFQQVADFFHWFICFSYWRTHSWRNKSHGAPNFRSYLTTCWVKCTVVLCSLYCHSHVIRDTQHSNRSWHTRKHQQEWHVCVLG